MLSPARGGLSLLSSPGDKLSRVKWQSRFTGARACSANGAGCVLSPVTKGAGPSGSHSRSLALRWTLALGEYSRVLGVRVSPPSPRPALAPGQFLARTHWRVLLLPQHSEGLLFHVQPQKKHPCSLPFLYIPPSYFLWLWDSGTFLVALWPASSWGCHLPLLALCRQTTPTRGALSWGPSP